MDIFQHTAGRCFVDTALRGGVLLIWVGRTLGDPCHRSGASQSCGTNDEGKEMHLRHGVNPELSFKSTVGGIVRNQSRSASAGARGSRKWSHRAGLRKQDVA